MININGNTKEDVLRALKPSFLEIEKIRKDENIKDKINKMYLLAENIKNTFESFEDFSIFLKIFNEMGKTKTKEKNHQKTK